MLGHIRFVEERGRRPKLEHRQVWGMTVLGASIPLLPGAGAGTLARRVDKAARLLAKQGVRRVLTPQDFSRCDLLRQRGLVGVDPAPLCAALCAPIALAALERRELSPHRATVALRGNRVSRPFFQAALALAPLVRGIIVTSPNGGEALSAHLRREFGVPVLEEGPGTVADLTVAFSPLPGEREGAVLLYGKPELRGVTVMPREGEWPDQFDVLPLAAALWEAGVISLEELLCV